MGGYWGGEEGGGGGSRGGGGVGVKAALRVFLVGILVGQVGRTRLL